LQTERQNEGQSQSPQPDNLFQGGQAASLGYHLAHLSPANADDAYGKRGVFSSAGLMSSEPVVAKCYQWLAKMKTTIEATPKAMGKVVIRRTMTIVHLHF
jgi:hypothetical protein